MENKYTGDFYAWKARLKEKEEKKKEQLEQKKIDDEQDLVYSDEFKSELFDIKEENIENIEITEEIETYNEKTINDNEEINDEKEEEENGEVMGSNNSVTLSDLKLIKDDNEEENNKEEAGEKLIYADEDDEEYENATYNGQQVSLSAVGIVENEEEEEDSTESGTNIKGSEKVSFEKIKEKKNPPRLRKGLIAAILLGSVFGFIMIVNILMASVRGDRNENLNNQNINARNVNNQDRFRIDRNTAEGNIIDEDGNMRIRNQDGNIEEVPLYDEALFRRRARNQPEEAVTIIAAPPPDPSDAGREAIIQQATLSPIGRSGGFGNGGEAQNISLHNMGINNYNQQMMNTGIQQTGNYQMDQLMFNSQQRRDEIMNQLHGITEMVQTQAGGNNNSSQRGHINNQTWSDAGRYNPNNETAGQLGTVFNDQYLFPGTIIHAVLVSRIDTDYPGPIHARVMQNVYDSMTGSNLLIPQGTILQGNYSSSSVGVGKVQIAWESMVVNYQGIAYQVSLGGMAGVDRRGRAGISGFLDDRYFEWLKAAGIITLFTLLNEEIDYQVDMLNNDLLDSSMRRNQSMVQDFSNRIMDRYMDIQPRVLVANGKAVSVAVNAPLRLVPFPAVEIRERYIRR